MKKLLFILFILIGYFSKSQIQYNPSLFTVSNKSFGVAQGVTTDARSWIRDTTIPSPFMRNYASRSEANTYLYLAKYRVGHFSLYIDSAGATYEYWYRNCTNDTCLVLKNNNPTTTDSSIFATLYRVDTAKTNLRTEIAGKVSTTLPTGQILAGNLSNVATPVTPGGVLSMTSGGAFDYVNNSILFSKIQTIPSHTVIGNPTGSTATPRSTYLKYGFLFDNDSTKIDTTLLKNVFGAGSIGWGLTGNAGTVEGTNFIGTTDNIPLSFRINNVASGYIGNGTTFNTFFGSTAGSSITSGQGNTGVGWGSAPSLTSGGNNTSMGAFALGSTDVGQFNTAIGVGSLNANTAGSNNTAIGNIALQNTSGNFNTALGNAAGINITTGHHNIVIGADTNTTLPLTTGSYNTIIGGNISTINPSFNNSVLIATGKGTERLRFDSVGNLKITHQTLINDTSTYKVLTQNASGNVRTSNWLGSSVSMDSTLFYTKYRSDTSRTNIYNAINGKQNTLTLTTSGSSGPATLIGATLNIPQYSGGGMTNPMTTAGDLIVGGTGGAPTRVGVGTNNQLWTVISGTPQWATSADPSVFNIVTQYGADPTGVVDACPLIQQAILDAFAAGGGVVYVPIGVYNIACAPTHNIGGIDMNAQLYIPWDTTLQTTTIVKIVGQTVPTNTEATPFYFPNASIPFTGPVFYSTTTVNNSTHAGCAVIGTNGPQNSLFGTFNYNGLEVENLTIIVKNNPNGAGPEIGGINLANMGGRIALKSLNFMVDTIGTYLTYPSRELSGFELPDNGGGAQYAVRDVVASGIKRGFVFGEHVVALNCNAGSCVNGISFKSGSHYSSVDHFLATWCINQIDWYNKGSSQGLFVDVNALDIEWGLGNPQWFNSSTLIHDTASLITGTVKYYELAQGGSTPYSQSLPVDGGLNIDTLSIKIPRVAYNRSTSTNFVRGNFAAGIAQQGLPASSGIGLADETFLLVGNTNASAGTSHLPEFLTVVNQPTTATGLISRWMSVNTAIPGSGSAERRAFVLATATNGTLTSTLANVSVLSNGTSTTMQQWDSTYVSFPTANARFGNLTGNLLIGTSTDASSRMHAVNTTGSITTMFSGLNASGSSAAGADFALFNDAGTGANHGFHGYMLSSTFSGFNNLAQFFNYENGAMRFGTNNKQFIIGFPSGNTRFGTTTTDGNAFVQTDPNTTSTASLLLAPSSAVNVSSPTSGMLWWNGTNLNFRTGSSTVDLLAGGSGGSDTLKLVNEGTGLPLTWATADTAHISTILATNGLTGSKLSDSTLQIVLGGTLTQNTNIAGASKAMKLGTSVSHIANLSIQSDSIVLSTSGGYGIHLSGPVVYGYSTTTSDVNYTSTADYAIELNVNITANRTLTLPTPAAINAGQKIEIWNRNTTGNSWQFSGNVVGADGSTITNLVNGQWYILMSNGTVWSKQN